MVYFALIELCCCFTPTTDYQVCTTTKPGTVDKKHGRYIR